jgi:hypothetical protein
MPAIFKKIRRKLAEENKVTSYLRYAVGEILLLVIGILIALQVNNWNEARKDHKLLVQYKNSMVLDLSQDTLKIRNILSYLNNLKVINDQIHARMFGDVVTIDTLIHLARFDFNPFIGKLTDYNTNTLQTLLSTGDISLLDSRLRKSILKHQQLQETSLNLTMYNIYLDKVSAFTQYFPLILKSGKENSFIDKQILQIDDERTFIAGMTDMVNYKVIVLDYYIDSYSKVMESTKQLIRDLKYSLSKQ